MKQGKRILAVTIKRLFDESPDTSHLGKYSQKMESDFSIDRKHSLDCIENDSIQQQKLQRIATFMEEYQSEAEHLSSPNGCAEGCEACEEESAYFEAAEIVRALAECDSDGCSCRYDSREYRFFNPSDNYKGELPEDIQKYIRQDYARMESLARGDWQYIGIRAEAIIETAANISQRITSGGLWGVESDSEASYLAEIQRDELAGLKTELIALGFSRRSISTAFKSVQERED